MRFEGKYSNQKHDVRSFNFRILLDRDFVFAYFICFPTIAKECFQQIQSESKLSGKNGYQGI